MTKIARDITPTDQTNREVSLFLADRWGGVDIVSKGKITDASKVSRVIARDNNNELIGLATYEINPNGKSCELISIDSAVPRQGIGGKMLKMVENAAKQAGCKTIWLVTTNNNNIGQRFYDKMGYSLVATHKGAVEEARKLKPSIPLFDQDGLPITDELEYEKRL
jgi:N-acetylglutamate synthase-like GNAT family acetyltransferase